ncbi:acyltransferase family protein [Pseudocnuella soli]|uniref:acyltransferase family protein n=1 Tax=Pseudocnuella soli TaxID=2502779 RepID=UPI0010431F73|nr:acyltransferase [Pseudocnuella soli]
MNTATLGQHTQTGKKHFEILDGLRGVAALAVVVFHFMEWVFSDFSKNFIAHGFLAVDFFFCLSGFVIAYAYDNRIEQIGTLQFIKLRLIRLHPLVVLGSVLGLLAFLFDPFGTPAANNSAGRTALLFVASALLIPAPIMADRAFNLFGLNAPSWSLFWEYVANVIYAWVLYKLGRRSLTVLLVIAALALGYVSFRAGNLLGGWSKDNFWDGGARVAYSFLAGTLIYRCNWVIINKLGFLGLSVLLMLAFLMPWSKWNWITELVVVLLYFPLIVALGAGSTLTAGLEKLCRFSGNISYPLYMTHYAAIWMFGNFFTKFKPGMGQVGFIIVAGTLFMLAFAYLTMKLYDVPVRKYLTRKMMQSKMP